MLLLGILSVFQLIVLPGLLLIRLFPGRRSWIQRAAFVFMLSLLTNYVVVFFLVAIHLYLRSVVLVLFAGEVAALVWLHRERLLAVRRPELKKFQSAAVKGLNSLSSWLAKDIWPASLYIVFGVLAALAVVWILGVWAHNFGTVFQAWDSWASWDRWAEKWASNVLPGDTWEYPQLIPILLSISYKFIGTVGVKFFGKSIMPLFALLIVLLLIDLGRRYRSYGYLIGAVLALYSLNFFMGKYFSEVYVDIPVACLSLLAVHTLLVARHSVDKQDLRATLALGSLATATAAVTKQTGLYIMAFYPVFSYFWVLRTRKGFRTSDSLKLIGKNLLLALLLVVPWYALIEYNILTGRSTSNIEYVIEDIYKGQTYWERFVAAVNSLGSYAYLFVFLVISLLVLPTEFQQLVVLVILPFSILWAVFLSYEYRNLAIAFPLLSMTTGVAIESWLQRLLAFLGRRKIKLAVPALVFILLALATVGAGSLALTSDQLIARQLTEQRKIFEPTLNQKLYSYFSRTEGPEPIITNYPINWLPGLNGLWRHDLFNDFSDFQQNLIGFSDSTLLLVPASGIDPAIMNFVWQQINAGIYQLEFTEANYMLIRIPPRK
jgi:hypothetical protein